MSAPLVDYPFGPFVPRPENPVLRPGRHEWESTNVYNPAAIVVDGRIALIYRAHADDIVSRLGLAWSDDGITFATPGPEWSKGGVILPEPIDGRYLMWFGEGNIHLAESEDLLHWKSDPTPVLRPEPGTFMGDLVETGPQPIRTRTGHVLLMHNSAVLQPGGGVFYACGQVLIDPQRPDVVVAKLTEPWLAPSTYEDHHGLVSNVTFVEGLVFHRGTWFAYYGQSDTTIGVATFTPEAT